MLREPGVADADAVAAVIRRASPHRSIDAEEVRTWLTQGLIDPDDMRVLDDDRGVAGYVDVFVREDLAYLDPNGAGHEDELLEWGEERARARGMRKVRLPVWQGQDDLAAAVERRGYRRVRSSFEMLIELGTDRPPAPEWPSGIDVRTYRPGEDERPTYETQEEAFRDAWDWRPTPIEQWRKFQLEARGFDPALWFLAWDGGEVAGICLSFPERAGDRVLGWISVLGVRRPWRRRGLGEALLRQAFRELHARGLRRVGLGVDAESPTGATRLYERVGMHVAVRSDSWDKQL
jgi:mycothiol synthase